MCSTSSAITRMLSWRHIEVYIFCRTAEIFVTFVKFLDSKFNSKINAYVFAVVLFCFLLLYTNDYLYNDGGNESSQSSFYSMKKLNHAFHPIPFENIVQHDISNSNYIARGTHDLIIRKHELELSTHKVEAESCLNIAVEMKRIGKYEKAMKILEHSFSLAPKDPDVLNTYGEFLEDIKKDIIAADQKYHQALIWKPDHKRALMNRQRTASVVEEIDKLSLRAIDEKRDKVSKIPDDNPSLRRTKKEAYFQHIYHTVGIEGNTMTLSETRTIVETRMAIGGKSIAEHNEILGLDSALKYINSTLIDRLGEINMEDILEVHRRVFGYVDPTESGQFRRTQVFVGGHIPPQPNHVPILMEDFVSWLNSEKAHRLHPIQLAAIVHYKLVHIHPFIDGNGRTARLLMNMILMRAGYPPVIIPKQERHRYYELLELANEGDIRPFVRFIAEFADKTLDLFLWSTSEYTSANIPALLLT